MSAKFARFVDITRLLQVLSALWWRGHVIAFQLSRVGEHGKQLLLRRARLSAQRGGGGHYLEIALGVVALIAVAAVIGFAIKAFVDSKVGQIR